MRKAIAAGNRDGRSRDAKGWAMERDSGGIAVHSAPERALDVATHHELLSHDAHGGADGQANHRFA